MTSSSFARIRRRLKKGCRFPSRWWHETGRGKCQCHDKGRTCIDAFHKRDEVRFAWGTNALYKYLCFGFKRGQAQNILRKPTRGIVRRETWQTRIALFEATPRHGFVVNPSLQQPSLTAKVTHRVSRKNEILCNTHIANALSYWYWNNSVLPGSRQTQEFNWSATHNIASSGPPLPKHLYRQSPPFK